MIDVISLARECPGTIVAVNASDLLSMFTRLVEENRKNREASKAEQCELRTREEVMKQLNIAPSTLWRWKQCGYLVPINVGGQYRYKSTDINDILEGKK